MASFQNRRRACALSVLLIWANNASAWDTSRPSEQELRSLPKFCQFHAWIYAGDTVPPMFGRTAAQMKAEFEHWKAQLGWQEGYMHTHHYCWGLGKLNRYYRNVKEPDRLSYVGLAVEDVTYTLTNSPKSYVLYPEMLTFRAKLEDMLNHSEKAVMDLRSAIQLNPKYQQAYISLAGIYVKHGQPEEAKKILQHALQIFPNSKVLSRHLTNIGQAGKPTPQTANKPTTPANP